eukprot:scaffold46322_cov60-Phaeocystis_antarctica.AAC.1
MASRATASVAIVSRELHLLPLGGSVRRTYYTYYGALLTMALRTMALLTMALRTMATLTMALRTKAPPSSWCRGPSERGTR